MSKSFNSLLSNATKGKLVVYRSDVNTFCFQPRNLPFSNQSNYPVVGLFEINTLSIGSAESFIKSVILSPSAYLTWSVGYLPSLTSAFLNMQAYFDALLLNEFASVQVLIDVQ